LKDTLGYEESRQLQNEGYLQEERVELRDNAGVRSIPTTSDKEGNGSNGYNSGLLEKILDRDNLNAAYRKVKENKGSHGVDGMSVDELLPYLRQHGNQLKQSILEGTYRPSPVRRVEIPKPDGGKRLLGIPTVVDRVIQQAIAQVLTPIYEEKFQDSSYGFRPGRNAKQAIMKSKEYIEAGYDWVVDIDLAKYFDTINHDKLMRLLSETIKDPRVQGGNMSPLLSNIMLNELDKELMKRGLKFCRYADDCNIYVRSRKAAERVMGSITRFIKDDLKLKVNREKSTVDRPWKIKFLGFSFYRKQDEVRIRVHPKSVAKFKQKLKAITGRSNGKSMTQRLRKLNQLIIGWVNYFGIADMGSLARTLDGWVRRRIRMCYWKQWKKISTKHANLMRLGISRQKAWEYANTRKSYWRIANSPILARALTNEYLQKIGYQSVAIRYSLVSQSY